MTAPPSSLLSQASIKIILGGHSSAGAKPANGDAFATHYPKQTDIINIKGITACLADGASCNDQIQLASQTAVTHFINDYYSTPDSWDVKKSAAKVISALNSWLFHHHKLSTDSNASLPHNKLLTTFSCMVFKSTSAHIFHVGDSRIYRLRNQQLEQLSRDHVSQYGNSLLLSKGLGLDQKLELDYCAEDTQINDCYILCSDGFYDWCDIKSFKRHLAQCQTDTELEQLASQMVTQAILNGSPDNCSCLILKVRQLPEQNLGESYNSLQQLIIPPALSPGQTIDHFTVLDIIHSGSRSHVYLVQESATGEIKVLKTPSQNFVDEPVQLEAFMREQWIGRRLNHPNLLKLSPPPSNSPFLYHLSEYAEGITLRQWIHDNHRPSFDSVRRIATSIVTAVRVLQRHGITHRDLKPENIMILHNGKIKLIDFGAAKVDSLDELNIQNFAPAPLGALDYSAPEYVQMGQSTHRSDIYSVGIIIYEMLVGELPYKPQIAGNPNYQSPYQNARQKRVDIPLWMDLCLAKACNKSIEYRYASLSEFMHDLSTPNNALLSEFQYAPFIEKNPLLFWQSLCWLLFLIALLQFYLLVND